MKKRTLFLLVIFMTTILISSLVNAAGLTFTDDFSSGNFSKWTNLAIEEGDAADTECAGKATIANNTLTIKNYDPIGSFFYLAPKGIKTKNFTVSMKAKANSIHDGWIGFSIRKETNDRYNGTNNIMIYFRHNSEGSWVAATRGYYGSVIDINANFTEQTTFTGDLSAYNTYKVVAKDSTFTAYINDVKVGVLVYDKSATNNPGYVSINAAVADVSIQNFKLETEDGTMDSTPTPEVTNTPLPTATKAPTAGPTTGTSQSSSQSSSSDSSQTSSESEDSSESQNGDESSQESSVESSGETSESNEISETESDSAQSETSDSQVSSESDDKDNTDNEDKFPIALVVILGVLVLGGAGAFAYFKFIKK